MKKLFFTLLVLLLPMVTMADVSGKCGDNLTWKFVESTGTLTISGTGEMIDYGIVVTPWKSYNSKIKSAIIEDGVTRIGTWAFADSYIKSIDIPSSVKSIGYRAFSGCMFLTDIVIPNGITKIETYTFSDCSRLNSVTIPSSVTIIEERAFEWCDALTTVNITDIAAWCNIEFGSTYSNPLKYANHLYKDGIEIKDLIIPSNVTRVAKYAFEGCSGLTSVTFHDKITEIGAVAFNDCKGLISVDLPNSITKLEGSIFNNCTSLKTIDIPNSVTSIGNSAFSGCSGLTSVTISNSVESIGNSAFSYCSSLTSINIPNGVTSINDKAFYGCSSLTSITIPKSVTSIGYEIFYGCISLESLIVEDGNIVYDSRDKCNAIVVTKSNTLLYGCKNSIIPNSINNIGYCAFSGCSGLTSVTIPNSVEYIDDESFLGCSGLTSVSIPNSVITIGEKAFSRCSSLTSITIPKSIRSISSYAFSGCSSLKNIKVLAETPPTVNNNIFDNYNTTLHVYASSIEAYKTASPWSKFTTIIPISTDINITNSISTFCSNSDLDFTSVSGLKAYIASGHNNNTGKVMLSRIYDVPAGTGVILMGETGSYNVPVAVASSSYSNYLKGVTTATTITPTSDGYNNYILANGINGIGFYPVGEEGTLAAGKAYLQLPSSVSSAKGFTLSFEDETTGISDNYEVEIMNSDAAVYDLQGRKVKNPSKGLYIVNGKKVVIK